MGDAVYLRCNQITQYEFCNGVKRMKELYTSPKLELLCLAPWERIANGSVDFDDLLGGGDGVKESGTDIDIPIIGG